MSLRNSRNRGHLQVSGNRGAHSRNNPAERHLQETVRTIVKENSALFWSIAPEEQENIDLGLVVETILNYGNEHSVKRLFDLVGINTVANIFARQTSRQRVNYRPRTIHYFTLYFQRHAQTDSHNRNTN